MYESYSKMDIALSIQGAAISQSQSSLKWVNELVISEQPLESISSKNLSSPHQSFVGLL